MNFKTLRKKNIGLLLILPWWIGFGVFKLYPFVSSLIYSFNDYNLFHSASFIGLGNYKKILGDKLIMKAFVQTFKYAFITVPLELSFALFIAYILNFKIKGVKFFRTAYYIPSILGGSVSIAVLWRFLFKAEGLVNMIAGKFGILPFNWLGNSEGAFWVIVLLRIWQFGSPMVIFLAALKGVSLELYEAASIDGAGKLRQLFNITIPLITPVIFYNFVTQLCNKFQEFNGPFIVTQGGPLRSTTLVSLLVYNNAFKSYEMGMASAIAWLLFLIIMTLTAILFISQKHWVYYSDEDGR
ncbi:MAG: sugar transporter permease [Lacrimispora sp.]|jgi:oligogalacturonide transport system permease protein|nr:sugar transporter permease [Lacrimispora sp.]